jgi:membrane-bound inhibitor of C-type lysozyme
MSSYSYFVVGTAAAAFIASQTPVLAQDTTFRNYHCADGTEFILGYYPYDSRVYLQIDGGPVILQRRLALSGTRYSGGGVTLKISKAGQTTVRHAKRPETACQVLQDKII